MDLRSSGIDQIDPEGKIRYPKEIVADEESNLDQSKTIMHFYSYQITIRTTLNLVQTLLYTPNRGRFPSPRYVHILTGLASLQET